MGSRSGAGCALLLTEGAGQKWREKRGRETWEGGEGGGPVEGGRHRRDFAVPDPSSSEAGLKFSPLGFVEILPYPSHKVIVLLEQTAVLCSQGAPARPPGPEEALPAEACSEDPTLQGSSYGPGPCPLSAVSEGVLCGEESLPVPRTSMVLWVPPQTCWHLGLLQLASPWPTHNYLTGGRARLILSLVPLFLKCSPLHTGCSPSSLTQRSSSLPTFCSLITPISDFVS